MGGYGNALGATIRIRNDKVEKTLLSHDTISSTQTLTTLDLSGQEINDEGIACMAKALADNQVILAIFSFLHLYSCYSDRP